MLWRVILFLLLISLLIFGVFLFVASRSDYSEGEPAWGVTYSPLMAEELELDPQETYLSILDDLGVTHLRLPSYWNRIEKTPGNYDWSELDWMISEAAARDVKVTLVIGQRQPRWPECHVPAWAENLPMPNRQDRILKFIEQVIRRYQDSKTIIRWQVENEPLLNVFGECPRSDIEFLKREIDLVKLLDNRPIMVTESGELSTWVRSAGLADILGVSLYRVTWNRYLGYLYYPLTPSHYHNKIAYVMPLVEDVICTELQTEPWATEHINKMSYEEMLAAMTLEMINNNAEFAKRSGFSEIYLWGVEWWYLMKEKFDDPCYWEEMKKLWE